VDAVDLDDVVKVIVGHDCRHRGSGWFLDKVVVYCPYSRGLKMLTFDCDRSVDRVSLARHVRSAYAKLSYEYRTYMYTHTHRFNGPLSGTTRVSRYIPER